MPVLKPCRALGTSEPAPRESDPQGSASAQEVWTPPLSSSVPALVVVLRVTGPLSDHCLAGGRFWVPPLVHARTRAFPQALSLSISLFLSVCLSVSLFDMLLDRAGE